jgi:hypothetical protein
MTNGARQDIQPDTGKQASPQQNHHHHSPEKPDSTQPRKSPVGNGDKRRNDNDGQYANNRPANGQGNGNRITGKQYRFIIDLMKEAGMTKREINDHCMDAYGAVVDHIRRSDASSLIDWLRSR